MVPESGTRETRGLGHAAAASGIAVGLPAIAAAMPISRPGVSRHLYRLKDAARSRLLAENTEEAPKR
jgi:hypothetical protein